jgi:hypothetical protein
VKRDSAPPHAAEKVLPFQVMMCCRIDAPVDTATGGRAPLRVVRPRHRAAASCKGQDFIPDEVEANSFRPGLIEKESRSRVNDVATQILPGISLSKDVFCQAFRAITAIGFLNGFKHQIGHV